MSSTTRQHPPPHKVNNAYVQVPPSPLTSLSNRVPGDTIHVVASSTKLKENTPLRPSQTKMSQLSGSSTSLKRKLLDCEPSSLVFDGVEMPAKRSKLASPLNAQPIALNQNVEISSEELSDGFAYCHQCNKKRDAKDTIVCTVVISYTTARGKPKERLCKSKYCKQCLKNRYNENLDTHKSTMATSGFKCPRCRDICNCRRCRKAKGLEPVGVIGNPLGKKSGEQKPVTKSKEKVKTKEVDTVKVSTVPKPKTPRILPNLDWRLVSVNMTKDEADDRIFIREFLFRFGDYLEPTIAKTHLEELEVLGGRPRKHDDDDETTSWVSDTCVKAIVLGLLGLLAKDREGNTSKAIKIAMKDIRAGGVNLNKIWSTLSDLREEVLEHTSSEAGTASTSDERPLSFCDPKSPPAVAILSRSLRSIRISKDMVNVINSWQMIPVFISLIHLALQTGVIREEFEQGLKDNKDVARDAKEASRVENERWEKERKAMEGGVKDKTQKAENRAKLMSHKEQISNIETALKIVGSSFAPRFTTLGTDSEGRIYYALSPGVAEREAALEYLTVASSEKPLKLKKKGRVLSLEERQEMREWTWFVAIWGKRPPSEQGNFVPLAGPKMDVDDVDDEELSELDEEEEDVSRWWGFWDADEIAKLAEWISVKSGLEEEEESSPSTSAASTISASSSKGTTPSGPRIEQLKRLVRGIRDYASLLRWRVREDRYTLIRKV